MSLFLNKDVTDGAKNHDSSEHFSKQKINISFLSYLIFNIKTSDQKYNKKYTRLIRIWLRLFQNDPIILDAKIVCCLSMVLDLRLFLLYIFLVVDFVYKKVIIKKTQ